MLLVNAPVPDPSVVVELAVVGFMVVDQHIPFAVTAEVPPYVTFPPELAVVVPIPEMTVVVTVGRATGGASVVKEISFPYAVPAAFVAYALT